MLLTYNPSQQLRCLYLSVQIDTHSWKFIELSWFLLIVAYLKKEVKIFNLTDTSYGMFKILPGITQIMCKRLHERDVCLRLPKVIRPNCLSLHCIERIDDTLNQNDNESLLSMHFNILKQVCSEFTDVIPKF